MPKFAKTLERIRDNPEDFYYGELAKDIVQDVKDGGGIFTLDDLKNYKVKFKRPVNGILGNDTWYSTPPPGSGAVLSLILNILKGKLKLQFIVEQRINSKCKLKCYVKSMKNPLGVSPSKGNQGATRGKEKIF